MSRLPSWILLVYLAIDLANPFVPGAVRFTPEEGLVWVEGMPRPGTQRNADERGPMARRAPRAARARQNAWRPFGPETLRLATSRLPRQTTTSLACVSR